MPFMIIERFRDNDMLPIYKRLRDEGRLIPPGLTYVDSWVEPNFSRCFQLMECSDARLLQQWMLKLRGSGVTFEFVPVVSSKETQEVVAPWLNKISRTGWRFGVCFLLDLPEVPELLGLWIRNAPLAQLGSTARR